MIIDSRFTLPEILVTNCVLYFMFMVPCVLVMLVI